MAEDETGVRTWSSTGKELGALTVVLEGVVAKDSTAVTQAPDDANDVAWCGVAAPCCKATAAQSSEQAVGEFLHAAEIIARSMRASEPSAVTDPSWLAPQTALSSVTCAHVLLS